MKEIPLTQGKVTIIDDEDFERINQFKWYAHKINNAFYARRNKDKKNSIILHRVIMNVTDPNQTVDHINGDTLDNRKLNLRVCDKAHNNLNRNRINKNNKSGYRGVHFNKRLSKWVAQINISKSKHKHLGVFNTAEEAARAYDKKAKELFGEFCGKLNLEK